MRSDISIQGIAPIASTGDPGPELKAATTAASSTGAATAPIFINPALRLEPALGLVVIEFRDSSGTVTNSIPTARQLHEYKQHAQTAVGSAPGAPAPAPTAAGQLGSSGTGATRDLTVPTEDPGVAGLPTAPNASAGETAPPDPFAENMT